MKRTIHLLTLMAILWVGLTQVCIAQVPGESEPGNLPANKPGKVMVLDFGWDTSTNAELIAPRAAWMLRKKMDRGDYDFPEIKERTHGETRVVWANRNLLDEYYKIEGIRWLIGGDVLNLAKDDDGEWLGPRAFGVAGIPVKGEIRVRLYDCITGKEVWSDEVEVKGHVHRLRVFGTGGSPIPGTPAAIDALIHSAVMELCDKLLAQVSVTEK
mgnify:CR=1 FL=1